MTNEEILNGLRQDIERFKINDKKLAEKQQVIFDKNKKLIEGFNKLPFYRRWGKSDLLRQKVIDNWRFI